MSSRRGRMNFFRENSPFLNFLKKRSAAKDAVRKTAVSLMNHAPMELAQLRKGINNFNVAVKEYGDEVIFLRQIVPGSTDRSYGIHVAKLAGLPDVVIKRAKSVLETLEKANAANPVSVASSVKVSAVRNKSRKGKDEDESELFQMRLF